MKDAGHRQRAIAKKLTVSFREDELPPLRRMRQNALRSYGLPVNCVIALPDDRIALAYGDFGDVRIFSLREPCHPSATLHLHATKVTDMTSLGGDIVASADCAGRVRTWNASTGGLLGNFHVGANCRAWTAICALHDGAFAVGDSTGDVHFLSHEEGRNVRPIYTPRAAHLRYISWMAHDDGTLVAASDDWTASVWEARSGRLVIRLPHSYRVFCTAVSKTYIATACGNEVRLYRNGGDYAMLAVYRGLHAKFKCFSVALAAEDLLVTGGADAFISYTSISLGRPVARSHTPIRSLTNIELLKDDRIVACSEWGEHGTIVPVPDMLHLDMPDEEEEGKVETRGRVSWRRNVFCALLFTTLAVVLRVKTKTEEV